MTGPEHYKEAERLIAALNESAGEASKLAFTNVTDSAAVAAHLQMLAGLAHVHATLALAAAVAIQNQPTAADRHAWAKVAGDRGGE